MMPASTRPSTFFPRVRWLISHTSATVKRLKKKALRLIIRVEAFARMASAAPKAAPEEAPRMSGAAIGF